MAKESLSRTIGAKVSAKEYVAIEARAAAEGKTTSSWVRNILIDQLCSSAAQPEICIILGELLALRTVVATLLFEASSRPPLKQETVREVLNLADQGKVQRAAELLKHLHGDI